MYHIIKWFMVVAIKPFLRKMEGLGNIPGQGGAVITANHASYLDHYIIGTTIVMKIKRPVYFLAKKEHFENPFQKIWHKHLKAIPLDREKGGKEAMARAEELLKAGHLVMIYPEGTRTLTGEMLRGRLGAARLALAAQVPIVPIGLSNTYKILPKGKSVPRLGERTDMIVGKPMYFEQFYGNSNKQTQQKVITAVMRRIAELAGTEYKHDQDVVV